MAKVKFEVEIEYTSNPKATRIKVNVNLTKENKNHRMNGASVTSIALKNLIQGGAVDWIETFVENEKKLKPYRKKKE